MKAIIMAVLFSAALLIFAQARSFDDVWIPALYILVFIGMYFVVERPRGGWRPVSMEEVDRLDGHAFEHFLKPLFEQHGYKAEVTRGSGDYGADLILRKDGRITVVQAKRYGAGKKIGVAAVQEVVGALAMYKAAEGMVVTNRYFTPQARRLANANGIRLVDRDELAFMMRHADALIPETKNQPQ